MCTVCGLEISSLPPRTLAVYMETHGGRKGGGARAGGGGGGGGSAAQLPSHMRSFSMKGGLVVSVTERAALESDAALLSRLRRILTDSALPLLPGLYWLPPLDAGQVSDLQEHLLSLS